MENAVRAADAAPARPRVRRIRRRHARAADRAPTAFRISGASATCSSSAPAGRSSPCPAWCRTRSSSTTSRIGAFPRAASSASRDAARLPRGARRLPRCLRSRADADEPGRSPTTSRRTAQAACGRASSACSSSLRASTGTRSSSAWCEQADGLRIYGSGIVSSYSETLFALDDASPNRIALRPAAGDAHALPDRRFPGNLLRDPRPRRAARARAHRFRAAVRSRSAAQASSSPATCCRMTTVITRGTGRYHAPPAGSVDMTPTTARSSSPAPRATLAAPSRRPSRSAARTWSCSDRRASLEAAYGSENAQRLFAADRSARPAAGRSRRAQRPLATLRPHRCPVQHRRRLPHGRRRCTRRATTTGTSCSTSTLRTLLARRRARSSRRCSRTAAARSSTSARSPRRRARRRHGRLRRVARARVIRLTEAMAAELRDQNINVNCVLPTIIDTPDNRAAMPEADPRTLGGAGRSRQRDRVPRVRRRAGHPRRRDPGDRIELIPQRPARQGTLAERPPPHSSSREGNEGARPAHRR